MTDLVRAAKEWIAGDPDSNTRGMLERLVDTNDLDGLKRAMGGTLPFGTAGIRGEVGPGSNRINRAMVIKTTSGLARHLIDDGRAGKKVVIGFDARPTSRRFAEDAAGVLAAAGIGVIFFPDVVPTPVVAFAAKHLEAGGAVVVTASHNPPGDNGYKVYGGNAAQIIPPEDDSIAKAISVTGPANEIPRFEDVFDGASELVEEIDPSIFDAYYRAVDRARPSPRSSDLKVVYTPMHGVAGAAIGELFARGGHTGLIPVPEQAQPDGTFPTVAFPNPEEPGALDLALRLAGEVGADAVIANDPDADRLAAAVPFDGDWHVLSGNDMGALLGDFVLRYWDDTSVPIVASSVVSSPILGRIAAAHGARHESTLTGFKWIVAAGLSLEAEGLGRFAFGYEEALGYAIDQVVRDKDGISAALVFADLLAEEKAAGRTVLDRLVDIWTQAGLWVSAQRSIVKHGISGDEAIQSAVMRLGDDPPDSIGGLPVTEVTDYRHDSASRPVWLGEQALIELTLGDSGRALVRPSGTEPKLKVYVDLVGECGTDPHHSHRILREQAARLAGMMGEWLQV
jgi:phosphomannomutase